jgi:hypothetical protein
MTTRTPGTWPNGLRVEYMVRDEVADSGPVVRSGSDWTLVDFVGSGRAWVRTCALRPARILRVS